MDEENWSDDDGSSNQPQQSQQYTSSQARGFDNNYNDQSSNWRDNNSSDNFRNSNNKRGRGNFRGDYNRRGFGRDDSGRRDFKRGSTNDQEEKSTFYLETSKIGKLIGRGGSKIRELQEQSGARLEVNKESSNGDSTLITAIGSKEAQNMVKSLIDDLFREDYDSNNSSQTNENNFGSKADRYQQDSRRDFTRGSTDSNEDKSTFYVETSKLGKLIGRGGCKIRELQDQSGARVEIHKESSDGGNTLVTTSGSKESLEKVKAMIDELMSDDMSYGSSRNYGASNTKESTQGAETGGVIDWDKAAKEYDEFQQQKWSKCATIRKNFYIEDPEVAQLSKEMVEQIRAENKNITVQYTFDEKTADSAEHKIPNPVQTFEQAFRAYPDVLVEIAKQGFEKPSPIQCQAWPILLSGIDMIGIAQTGTGKTLAFLLPALIHIDGQETPRDKRNGPTVLIMAPTRELAVQIKTEVDKYDYHGIRAVCVYGGGNRKEQMNTVSRGVEIVIATPGRLNDLVQTGVLDVTSVSYLVLDEADRMLDMGFEPQIRKTLLDVRPDRQSIMTSATWPPGVRRLAASYMKNPITVCVGSLDLKATHSVSQKIYIIDEEEKTEYLKEFFHNMGPNDKVIVFFGKKSKVDDIGSDLALSNVSCQSIHGGREQCDREQALEDIKVGTVNILLATDVASRGIDIEDLTHVLNYDFPRDIEEYVHRVGRTGRAGRTGESISLMTRKDWGVAAELIKILEEAEQEVPEELFSMAERYGAMQKRRSEERGNDRGGGGRRYGGGGGFGGGGGGGGGFGGGRRGGNRW